MQYRSLGFVMSACLCGALFAGCAGGGSSVTQSAGTVPSSVQRGTVAGDASLGHQAPSGVRRTLSVPTCSARGKFAFVGGTGGALLNVAGGGYSFVGAGQDNQACDGWSAIAGGYQNAISKSIDPSNGDGFIGGGEFNVLTGVESNSAIVAGNTNEVSNANSAVVGGTANSVAAVKSLVGGGDSNTIAAAGTDAAIVSGYQNNLSGEYGFIGGGSTNTLSATYGVIAGGSTNTASSAAEYSVIGGGNNDQVTSPYGVISGGNNNTVSSPKFGTIGGGNGNTVSGQAAVVAGGGFNSAGGQWATVPGGQLNVANGQASFAAGYNSNAATTGAFVWSDSTSGATQLTSTAANQFLARATGGFTFWTNAANTVGATLASGSGTWASASDRNLKTDVVRIDDAAVLNKVARLPIDRWSYKSERGVRHVGPMAQDFYAAFGVGEDDKHITSIDEDGVALAAIKALHAENADAHAAMKALHAENASLRAQLAALKASQARHDLLVDRELQRLSTIVSVSRER